MNTFIKAAFGLALSASHMANASPIKEEAYRAKINGKYFQIDCTQDIEIVRRENGKTTARLSNDSLGRIDSHFHGAVNNKGRNVNLYSPHGRNDNLETAAKAFSFSVSGQNQFKASMLPKLAQYDNAPNKRQYLQDQLAVHGFTAKSQSAITKQCLNLD